MQHRTSTENTYVHTILEKIQRYVRMVVVVNPTAARERKKESAYYTPRRSQRAFCITFFPFSIQQHQDK